MDKKKYRYGSKTNEPDLSTNTTTGVGMRGVIGKRVSGCRSTKGSM